MDSQYSNFKAMPPELGQWQTIALGVGGIASLLILIWTFVNPAEQEHALRAWLLGVVFWGGISVGSLGLLLLQYVAGGAWGVVIRRTAEASSRNLLAVAGLFIPIVIGTY